jgi:hypothetical protein
LDQLLEALEAFQLAAQRLLERVRLLPDLFQHAGHWLQDTGGREITRRAADPHIAAKRKSNITAEAQRRREHKATSFITLGGAGFPEM